MYYLEQIEPSIWAEYSYSVLGRESDSIPLVSPIAVGARLSGEPVGVAVACPNSHNRQSAVIRICNVVPRHRRIGIGAALLRRMETVLAKAGFSNSEVWIPETHPLKPVIDHLVQRAEWPPLEPGAYVCRTNFKTLHAAPWISSELPEYVETFHWSQLTADDRRVIEEGRSAGLFPEAIYPLKFDPTVVPMPPGSRGFRYRGQLAGWCVAHYLSPTLAYVDSLYTDPRLNRPALAIAVLAGGIRMTPDCDYIFDVSFERFGMRRFVDRRMTPYLTSIRCMWQTSKPLSC